MIRIAPSTENLFLFWSGDPAGRLEQINTAIGSFAFHNPGMPIHLFTNELDECDLDERMVADANLDLVRWTPATLVEGTSFEPRAAELEPDYIASRHDGNTPIWIVYSDFFRYVALWRWGGTYLDLDDVTVAPLPAGRNLVCSSIPSASPDEPGFGELVRDRTTRAERYLRIGTHPLVRFEPGHEFMRRCLELALSSRPGVAGSRTLTRAYTALENPDVIGIGSCIDFQLHPGLGMTDYVRRHAGLGEKWWWSTHAETEFLERWPAVRRLGTFFSVKNHGWKPLQGDGGKRLFSQWVCVQERARIEQRGPGGHPVAVSVVIPTYRERYLADALQALARQREKDFEVLVVENGERSPGAARAVARFSQEIALHHVFEPRLGLNAARNLGGRLARGRILAFLDDDCQPDADWVARIVAAHRADQPRVVAGRVSLAFEGDEPAWLHGTFRELLSELDPDRPNHDRGRWVVGANFSVPRRLFEQLGGFDETFGMVGKSPRQLCNDETEFCRRAERLTGLSTVFDGSIGVLHRVPSDRLAISRFEQRMYGQGLSDAALIRDRERRAVTDVLEKLERTLYDAGWHERLQIEARDVPPKGRSRFVSHCVRIRQAYLAGLAQGCLDAGAEVSTRRIERYRRAGAALAARWLRDGLDTPSGLRRLARLSTGAVPRKNRNHHRYTAPEVMLGRAEFLHAAARALASADEPAAATRTCPKLPAFAS